VLEGSNIPGTLTVMDDGQRWLDYDEQRAWRGFLAMATLLPGALDQQLQRDAEMGHSSYIVLAMLSEAPDRSLRMSDLAARANSSPSRLSHTVTRLEQRGWVRRERSAEDGRGSIARLTDDGWDVVVATAPGHVAAVRRYVQAEAYRHLREGGPGPYRADAVAAALEAVGIALGAQGASLREAAE